MPYQRPFAVYEGAREKATFTLSVNIVNSGYCVGVHFRKHSVIWGG
jgi:hypothetical protein